MQCPCCRTDCPDGDDFCRSCGRRLAPVCPRCRAHISPTDRFCGCCGEPLSASPLPPAEDPESGRRYVTVLFCDLTHYTVLAEKLDPEDVKEIIGRIFKEIIRVVVRYGGRIEKFIGDAAMIIFGVPRLHEDDPVRALRAAFEIHRRVGQLSPDFEARCGQELKMHTGINTGLVVVGSPDPDSGVVTVTGDTVNVAARLEGLAAPGEILVGPETYSQARGYFEFEALAPTPIKGKTEPVRIFKALGPELRPVKLRKPLGRRAVLIGRQMQSACMQRALARFEAGEAVILGVCGEAGTGKSRLTAEFKISCRNRNLRWIEAHAHAYTQNSPYSLFIDLLHRAFGIRESDPPDSIQMKIETGLNRLMQDRSDVVPYVTGLFSISDPSRDAPSPDIWKTRLHRAVGEILAAVAENAPTVICLEDLHWADPSSLELMRTVLSDLRYPLMVICIYRTALPFFTGPGALQPGVRFENITLGELTAVETVAMLKSLLKTDRIPEELRRFVVEKVGGNPFYLEEVVNSLIEDQVLTRTPEGWILEKTLEKVDLPPTIHGVITGRLDRMEKPLRRVLQEAAVIGRTFFYEILQKISSVPRPIDEILQRLEHLDLIQVRTLRPHLEYLFKHALIQEVAYNGLLKSERKLIHGRIGKIIEALFGERLSEFYESLAYHFQRSGQPGEAVAYLLKAGEKSARRYALEEAHRYFNDAYHLVQRTATHGGEDTATLIDILNKWAFVFYYRGRYRELYRLMMQHKDRAEHLAAGELQAMYYAWLGCALWHRERFHEARPYLMAAFKMAEQTGNLTVMGYAASWLVWIYTELGRFDDALAYAARAQSIFRRAPVDPYIQVNSLAGMGYALWHRGERKRVFAVGRKLLRIGWRHADSRSRVMGYCCIGWSRLIAGDGARSSACFRKAVAVSDDPWYSVFPRLALCYGLISEGRLREAGSLIGDIIVFSRERGAEFAGTPAKFFRSILWVSDGNLTTGLSMLERQLATWEKNGSRLRYALCGCILAEIYARLACRPAERLPARWLKHVGNFLNIGPSASRKASMGFARCIQAAEEMGADGVVGRAYLNWGRMRQYQGRWEDARQCFDRAAGYFRKCGATGYLEQAQEALQVLKQN